MPDTRGPMRPTLLCSLCLTVLSAPASIVAQAVPVLAVTVQDRPPPADLVTRVAAAVGADAHAERSTTTERRPRLRCIARTMLHESRGAFTRIPHNGRARWRWKCERASGNTPPPL